MAGVDLEHELIARDYAPRRPNAAAPPRRSSPPSSPTCTARPTCSTSGWWPGRWDSAPSPRSSRWGGQCAGLRLLARVPRLPHTILERLVDHFGGLQKLLATTVEDLQAVEGVGEAPPVPVREAISRLADASIIDRYPLSARTRVDDRLVSPTDRGRTAGH